MMASTWLTVLCLFLAATDFALSDENDKTKLKVTTLLTEPFAQYISVTALPTEFEGYIIDLLDELATNGSFEFEVKPVEDGKYGALKDGQWNGMIGELVKGNAQLAAAPLTNTTFRADTVTFLNPPFMAFDLAILMKKHDSSSNIQSVMDLHDQEKIDYGVVSSGTTADFFKTAQELAYKVMWSKMDSTEHPTVVDSVEDGVDHVRKSADSEPYAFIGEEHIVKYHASREPCDLMYVDGKVAGYKGEYHLAVEKNYNEDIVKRLQTALVNLKSSGRLKELYKKWWTERAQCNRAPSSTLVTSGIAVLVPVVVVLLLGLSSE